MAAEKPSDFTNTDTDKPDQPPEEDDFDNLFIFEEKITVGIKVFPIIFNIESRLLGKSDEIVEKIFNETGATISLRGKGLKASNKSQNYSNEPLHVLIRHRDRHAIQRTRDLVINLIEIVHEDFIKNYGKYYERPAKPVVLPGDQEIVEHSRIPFVNVAIERKPVTAKKNVTISANQPNIWQPPLFAANTLGAQYAVGSPLFYNNSYRYSNPQFQQMHPQSFANGRYPFGVESTLRHAHPREPLIRYAPSVATTTNVHCANNVSLCQNLAHNYSSLIHANYNSLPSPVVSASQSHCAENDHSVSNSSKTKDSHDAAVNDVCKQFSMKFSTKDSISPSQSAEVRKEFQSNGFSNIMESLSASPGNHNMEAKKFFESLAKYVGNVSPSTKIRTNASKEGLGIVGCTNSEESDENDISVLVSKSEYKLKNPCNQSPNENDYSSTKNVTQIEVLKTRLNPIKQFVLLHKEKLQNQKK